MTEPDAETEAEQAKPSFARTAWRILGIFLSLIAFLYIAYALFVSGASVTDYLLSPLFIASIILGGIFYGIMLQFVGAGWWFILLSLGDRTLSLEVALSIFGRTQVYKYLPTNVLHMAGRIGEARLKGAATPALIIAQILEFALLAAAAALLSGALGWSLIRQYAAPIEISPVTIVSAIVLFSLIGVPALILVRRYKTIRNIRVSAGNIIFSFLCYVLFFLLNGILLKLLGLNIGGIDAGLIALTGIGSTAWLLGFIVPGAPGGLGVREAIMIAALSELGVGEPAALALAISHRLSTVIGDGSVAVYFVILRKSRKPQG